MKVKRPPKYSGALVVVGVMSNHSKAWCWSVAVIQEAEPTLPSCSLQQEAISFPIYIGRAVCTDGGTAMDGSLYLYTSELGTTAPPELYTSRLSYNRFRQNRRRYYMINRTKVHQRLCGKMVLHGKQEYCTSLKIGILYNTENRNFVQHRKQEYCTSLI